MSCGGGCANVDATCDIVAGMLSVGARRTALSEASGAVTAVCAADVVPVCVVAAVGVDVAVESSGGPGEGEGDAPEKESPGEDVGPGDATRPPDSELFGIPGEPVCACDHPRPCTPTRLPSRGGVSVPAPAVRVSSLERIQRRRRRLVGGGVSTGGGGTFSPFSFVCMGMARGEA